MSVNQVLWHDNVPPTYDVKGLVSEVCIDQFKTRSGKIEFAQWSTFAQPGNTIEVFPDHITVPFYKELISRVMLDLGLEFNSLYEFKLWTQVYEGNGVHHHGAHNHWRGGCILSWVHFLEPAEKDCFCFLDSNMEPTFPKQQRKNDIIFFPSWQLHQVLPFRGDKRRVIVAGNVELTTHELNQTQRLVHQLPDGLTVIQSNRKGI